MLTLARASSQYLQIDSTPVTGYPWTAAGWYRPSADILDDSTLLWIGDKDAAANYWRVMHNAFAGANTITFTARNTTAANAVTSTTLAAGVLGHWCAVAASATDRRVYLNGAGVGTNTTSQTPTVADRVAIGRSSDSTPTELADGDVGETCIWAGVALGVGEIAALAAGTHPLLIRSAAVAAYWPLWGLSSPERDYTAGFRDLTLNGAPAAAARQVPLGLMPPIGMPAGAVTAPPAPPAGSAGAGLLLTGVGG